MAAPSRIEGTEGVPLRVVALANSDELRARLRGVLAECAELHFCRSQRQLVALAAMRQPTIIIIELVGGDGGTYVPAVRSLRAAFPTVPIIASCALSGAVPHDILTLAKVGVTGLALRGFDDIGDTIERAVRSATAESVTAEVLERLDPDVPTRVRPILEYCIANAGAAPTVTTLAEALGMPRKTLTRQLRGAGFPPPSRLIAWGRLLIAARLMEDAGRSLERIALDLSFPSATAMRKLLRRLTGLRPIDVRERGGLACVQTAFHDTLRAAP